MASNQNKFFDRSPTIAAAGKSSDNLGNTVANCMKEYLIEDAKNALKHVANIDETANRPVFKVEPYKNKVRKGIFTETRPILQPKVKTRYEALINELKETAYDSHWNKVVGKGRDPIPRLPNGLNPDETTFGRKTQSEGSVKELVNPPKNIYQVLTESQIGHEFYKVSHNSYNPGEQLSRNYLAPSFDKTKRFGKHTTYDPRGIWVKCACTWCKNEPVVFTNKIQAEFLNKKRSILGRSLAPNNIAAQLSKDFIYGRPPKQDFYSVEELLRDPDCPPCEFKRDLKTWLSSFNKLKIRMRKRICPEFNFKDLYKSLLHFDKDKCGYLPLEKFYEVCACHRFFFDRANFEPLLCFLSIICEDQIWYRRFLDIIDSEDCAIKMAKVEDYPENNLYYLSTNQAASCDCYLIDNTNLPMAGIPSIRYDLPRPIVPTGGCRADLENLGDECSAAILINPSIFFSYNLSFRDFFVPREKQVIRSIFEKIGYKFDDKIFEELWQKAMEIDKSCLVCVETFDKLLLKHYNEQRNLTVDEATC